MVKVDGVTVSFWNTRFYDVERKNAQGKPAWRGLGTLPPTASRGVTGSPKKVHRSSARPRATTGSGGNSTTAARESTAVLVEPELHDPLELAATTTSIMRRIQRIVGAQGFDVTAIDHSYLNIQIQHLDGELQKAKAGVSDTRVRIAVLKRYEAENCATGSGQKQKKAPGLPSCETVQVSPMLACSALWTADVTHLQRAGPVSVCAWVGNCACTCVHVSVARDCSRAPVCMNCDRDKCL